MAQLQLTPEQQEHKGLIERFLLYINAQDSQYVLKGGTALMECYGLDRFSEDIDLDGRGGSIAKYVDHFAKKEGISYTTKKDTDTVKRFMLHTGEDTLKIEVSYRSRHIDPETVHKVNGIQVYVIDSLAMMKNNAYQKRYKIRDMYDLTFMLEYYYDQIEPGTRRAIADQLSDRGYERFDELVKDQSDALIPPDRIDEMTTNFLGAWEKLGLVDEQTLAIDHQAHKPASLDNTIAKAKGLAEHSTHQHDTRGIDR